MGKTQEIVAVLHQAQRRGQLPRGVIYIGGLGKNFTAIYDRFASRSERKLANLQILEDIRPALFSGKTLSDFRPRKGNLYLLPSGMMTESTTSNRVAEVFLAREENSVYFVGYTDPDSPAGKLRATPRGGQVALNDTGPQTVKCEIRHFDFTSHATREDLIEYALRIKPRHCILVHGDRLALEWFAAEIPRRAREIKVTIPESGAEIEL
jgi:predicted metal-dependent RNase